MKHLFATFIFIIIISFCLNFDSRFRGSSVQQGNYDKSNFMDLSYFPADFSDFINNTGNRNISLALSQQLIPAIIKHPFKNILTDKLAGLKIKTEISHYKYFTDLSIPQATSPDIIFPFDYFW